MIKVVEDVIQIIEVSSEETTSIIQIESTPIKITISDVGLKGTQGIQGETGPQGPQGPAGNDAPSIHSGLILDDGTNPHETTKADVGLGNVDNTSDLNKPISTATQTALDGKANTSHTHVASDITDFQAAVSLNTDLVANITEVQDARFSQSTLANNIGAHSLRLDNHKTAKRSGQWYDNSNQGQSLGSTAGAANRMDLAPYFVGRDFEIDRFAIMVTTANAGSQVKVVIYTSDFEGWPDILIYESIALDTSTTGAKEVTVDPPLYMDRGKQYWFGVRHSSNPSIRTITASTSATLGMTNSSSSANFTITRRTVLFADPAPNPYDFPNNSGLGSNQNSPSVRFRVL